MDSLQNLLTRRNIATFLIIGILVLSIPFTLKLTQRRNPVNSSAAQGICLDNDHLDHTPLYNIDFYSAIEDSDEGACQCPASSTDSNGNCTAPKIKPAKPECSIQANCDYVGSQPCGFIWHPDHGKLHLGLWDASKIGSCQEQAKSYCSDAYYSVINDPLFPVAVALMDKMFRLDQTSYIFAVNNPALGRGDDRSFDPAWRVAGFLDATSKNFFHQLNPNNIHDPVEWLYDRGFWARPTSGSGSVPRPGVANPAPTGKGFAEEYYGHYQNSFNVDPGGHIGMTPDRKSIIDYVKQHNLRQKTWTELICTNSPNSSANSATCGNFTVPATVTPGQSFNVSLTMNNPSTGKPWSNSSNYRLGSTNPMDNNKWGVQRVSLPSDTQPGQSATFSFSATAPNTTGSQDFSWRMVQDGVEWFGDTCQKSITVGSTNTLAAPTNFKAGVNVANKTITLSWDGVSGITTYKLRGLKNPTSSDNLTGQTKAQRNTWYNQNVANGPHSADYISFDDISCTTNSCSLTYAADLNVSYTFWVDSAKDNQTSDVAAVIWPAVSLSSTSAPPTAGCDFSGKKVYDDIALKIWTDEFSGNKPVKRIDQGGADCGGSSSGGPDGVVDLTDFILWRNEKFGQ